MFWDFRSSASIILSLILNFSLGIFVSTSSVRLGLSPISHGIVDDVYPGADSVKDCPQNWFIQAPWYDHCQNSSHFEARRDCWFWLFSLHDVVWLRCLSWENSFPWSEFRMWNSSDIANLKCRVISSYSSIHIFHFGLTRIGRRENFWRECFAVWISWLTKSYPFLFVVDCYHWNVFELSFIQETECSHVSFRSLLRWRHRVIVWSGNSEKLVQIMPFASFVELRISLSVWRQSFFLWMLREFLLEFPISNSDHGFQCAIFAWMGPLSIRLILQWRCWFFLPSWYRCAVTPKDLPPVNASFPLAFRVASWFPKCGRRYRILHSLEVAGADVQRLLLSQPSDIEKDGENYCWKSFYIGVNCHSSYHETRPRPSTSRQ